MKKERHSKAESADSLSSARPLSALLSQILVAFTLDLDNEFEQQMTEAGNPGARLSLFVWSNLIRFVPDEGISVRDLVANSLVEQPQIALMLGCLERWGFVAVGVTKETSKAPKKRLKNGLAVRDGWGSGRGIAADSIVRLTAARGAKAKEIWPPLFEAVQARWRARFGKEEIQALRDALQAIIGHIEIELPHGFIDVRYRKRPFPHRRDQNAVDLPLPTLLSRALLAFAIDFERESAAPFALCANAIRVLGEKPIRESEIPRLTGSSPETSGVGWQLKPYIVVERDPTAQRGKVIRLSPRGLEAQRNYQRLTSEIEKRWESRFGRDDVSCLRESLQALLKAEKEHHPLLSEGLVPTKGTLRAGDVAPALGRRDVGAAAKQRARDMVTQTEAFLRDPSGSLPHYPLWDMNRGFGP
jgi:DNA-binding MarR family transcriptional regulator